MLPVCDTFMDLPEYQAFLGKRGKMEAKKGRPDAEAIYGQKRREEFKKALEGLEGALKFSPGVKIKPEQELCFQGLVV